MNKLCILAFMLLSIESSYSRGIEKSYKITFKFESKQHHEQWMTWYLDQGGEESSGFIVKDWNEKEYELEYSHQSYPLSCVDNYNYYGDPAKADLSY